MSRSTPPEIRYPSGVIRPARRPAANLTLSGLGELLGVGRDIPDGPARISGATLDSRRVQAGDLYAALPGERTHGAAYCEQAVAAGAVAILTDPDGRDRAARCGVPVFVVNSPRERLGDVSCWIYGDPSTEMRLIGGAGAAGQSTTT